MDVINTLKSVNRVSSIYAENYFDDESTLDGSDKNKSTLVEPNESEKAVTVACQHGFQENWVSPSDLLIGKIELTPPFTSKVTRGITHEGILSIGGALLAKDRRKFEKELRYLLHENDAAWNYILEYEKQQVKSKVWHYFKNIFEEKRKTMNTEISKFYENSLLELESHLRSEIENVLVSAHAKIISDLNIEINKKLKEERLRLETIFEKQYRSEVYKIIQYYKLMSDYESNRNNKLITEALYERNDALNIFYKQIEAETMTSTMYVMSLERKKCKIKQFFLENYQNSEIQEKLQKIKRKQEIIDSYKQRERFIPDINFEWKNKVKKILQLFLKFISYSLKLLPEQTTFLLELEKMFVLQLNEIEKNPESAPKLLIDVDENMDNTTQQDNVFDFKEKKTQETTCDREPFEVVGDTADSIPTPYGSRETIPSHVDLPSIRLSHLGVRKFVYAKCDKFDEVQALFKQGPKVCKCIAGEPSLPEPEPEPEPEPDPEPVSVYEPDKKSESTESESSLELMQVDEIKRMLDCPHRYCRDWTKHLSFDVSPFVDFSEDNYRTVKNRFDYSFEEEVAPKIINAKEIAHSKLPFVGGAATHHDAGTQCSSVDDMPNSGMDKIEVLECTCVKPECTHRQNFNLEESRTKLVDEIMVKRRISLQRLLFDKPNLTKMFTDESFDFKF